MKSGFKRLSQGFGALDFGPQSVLKRVSEGFVTILSGELVN